MYDVIHYNPMEVKDPPSIPAFSTYVRAETDEELLNIIKNELKVYGYGRVVFMIDKKKE